MRTHDGPITAAAEFNRLPLLLKYRDLLACGIPERSIKHLVASGQLTCVCFGKGRRRYYRRQDVARLLFGSE